MNPGPRDHPSLQQYPDQPTMIQYIDGVPWRLPIRDQHSEAVAVPVTDLMQARAVVGILRTLISNKIIVDPAVIELIGRTAATNVGDTTEPFPRSNAEVEEWLSELWSRLNSWLPRR